MFQYKIFDNFGWAVDLIYTGINGKILKFNKSFIQNL